VDRRSARSAQDLAELGAKFRFELDVDGGERLVQEHEAGTGRERPRKRDPLELPARELVRSPFLEPFEVEEGEQPPDLLLHLRRGTALEQGRVGDVLVHGPMREQRGVLKHQDDPASVGRLSGDIHTVEPYAALGGALEARQTAEQRRLATPVRAEEDEKLALVDAERHVPKNRLPVPRGGEPVHLEDGLRARHDDLPR